MIDIWAWQTDGISSADKHQLELFISAPNGHTSAWDTILQLNFSLTRQKEKTDEETMQIQRSEVRFLRALHYF